MSGHGFTSALGVRLDEYVEFKRAMGFNGASRIWYLRRFDAYCAEHALSVFDRTCSGLLTAPSTTWQAAAK